MSSRAKLVEEWNNIVEYKIRESDLKNPTFDFFFQALNSFLRSVNDNTEDLRHNLPDEEIDERLFYIRFCHRVNRYCKLYKDVNLYYTDLINPTQKKCFQVLKLMLNYLKFYEMTKKEIYARAQEHLDNYNAVLNEKNELEVKIERSKREARDKHKKQIEYTQRLTELKETIRKYEKENQENDKKRHENLEAIKNCEAQIINFEMQENKLQENIVNVQDYEQYVQSIDMMKKELDELRAEKNCGENTKLKTAIDIEAIEGILKEINEIIETVKIPEIEKLPQKLDEVNQITANVGEMQEKLKRLTAEERKKIAEVQDKKEKIKEYHREAKIIHDTKANQFMNLKKNVADIKREIDELKHKLDDTNACLEEQKIARHYLHEQMTMIIDSMGTVFAEGKLA